MDESTRGTEGRAEAIRFDGAAARPAPLRALGRLAGVLSEPWRRSLAVRVISGTLVLSTCVTVFVGWLLLNQVADDLYASKVRSAQAEASGSVRAAQEQIDVAEPSVGESELVNRIAEDLWIRGRSTGLYEVVVISGAVRQSPGLDPDSLDRNVPTRLRKAVSNDRSLTTLHGTYSQMIDRDGEQKPAIAIGSRVSGPGPDLEDIYVYHLFPLSQEQSILRIVQQALIVAGVVLVLLLGLVAWFVTRQAVTPVRMARQTAERLASGLLEERMQVRGKDDLARLARSFNQMASNLQRQIRQLEEMSRVQRRFVSDVSHELRTPLTTVRMAGDVLHEARSDFDPSVARAAELLRDEIDRFEALLADLLEISRYDAGATGIEREQADLVALTRRVVDGVRALADRKGSTITLHPPTDRVNVDVALDAKRIERVVRNLVSNAAEYGNGGEIVVRVAADDTAAAVSVRDYGVGLKPGEAAQVFDRFWRADPARARSTGGTGLGLAIALEDTLAHGGWLQAWGSPGRGSHFRLTLPKDADTVLDHSPIPLVPESERGVEFATASGQPIPSPTPALPRTLDDATVHLPGQPPVRSGNGRDDEDEDAEAEHGQASQSGDACEPDVEPGDGEPGDGEPGGAQPGDGEPGGAQPDDLGPDESTAPASDDARSAP